MSGSLGLLAKARSDRELLIAALYAAARYDGVVDISDRRQAARRRCRPTPSSAPARCRSRSTSTPGRVFTLGDVALKGDAAGLMPADFGLIPGGDAGSDAILKAEALIVRALKEEGRPLAKVTDRDIVADHATSTLDVTLTVEAGPVAGYGDDHGRGNRDGRSRLHRLHDRLEARQTPTRRRRSTTRATGCSISASSTASAFKEGDELDANGTDPDRRRGQRAQAALLRHRRHRLQHRGARASKAIGATATCSAAREKLRIEGSISGIGDTSDYRQAQLQCRRSCSKSRA